MKMRRCSKCHKNLPPTSFWRESGRKRHTWCITCKSLYMKTYYQKNKKRLQKSNRKIRIRLKRMRQLFVLTYLKTHPCVDCGEDNPIVLEFDHVRGKKVNDISGLIENARSEKVISKEMAKCEVRCSNCHKKKTAKEYGWFDYIDFNTMTITNWKAKRTSRKRHLQNR
jgi:5-methylcytosine-specific restriction endonuclease McrA